MFRPPFAALLTGAAALAAGLGHAQAQLVVLPAPRLLTTMPMGAKVGATTEVTVTSENAEDPLELIFSNPNITAKPKTDETGAPVRNKFVVSVAPQATPGLYEARLTTRLGVSSSRCFSVGRLEEVTRAQPNTAPDKALALPLGSVCNAFTTSRAADYYSFQATKGQRVFIDCAAQGIDSKLVPVLAITDLAGKDIVVERRSGFIDFTTPADGAYLVKIHSLTYQGGAESFYRLAIQSLSAGATPERQPATRAVGSASLPTINPALTPWVDEIEPNNKAAQAQRITLPCTVRGNFATAGDVDTFEFSAKKGELWCLEVVSARLGLPTDPFVLLQRVVKTDGGETLTDVAEFNDIASPVKLSSYGYAYDGAPYDTGSLDPLGKFEIKEDGIYRLQIRDLYGGARAEPRNTYQMILRKPVPDFSLVAWAEHMELRNGDRANLSKPMALRGGATAALEVTAVRKDGFDGEIELAMENLPPGVTAAGLRIPPGKSQGVMLITAAENAPRGMSLAKIVGRAKIDDAQVTRECPTASMAWPVKDHSSEIPVPRLFADFPVSVGGAESTPLTIATEEPKVWEASAGAKLQIPLKLTWRGDFSGGPVKLKPLGADFSGVTPFDIPSKAAKANLILDLAQLKTPPGEYTLAFHGGVVAKYRYNPDAIKNAEAEQKLAEQKVTEAAETLQKLTNAPKVPESEAAAKAAAEKVKAAEAAKTEAAKRVKQATDAAAPKDIVDIVVTEPIRVRVKPADSK